MEAARVEWGNPRTPAVRPSECGRFFDFRSAFPFWSGAPASCTRIMLSVMLELLGKDSADIDIALDNMIGRNFSEKVKEYSELMGEEQRGIGVIQWYPIYYYANSEYRAKGEMYYNHSLGMQYNKITEQIFVGSCIQTERDVKMLSETVRG